VSTLATFKKKTRSTTHPLGIIFNKFSLALQTYPTWHGFNDIPQNININNSITNRLKEHLLYQVNHAVSPAEAEMSDIHVVAAWSSDLDSDTFSSLVFKLLSLQ
jgi:hypothetical protein